MSRFAIVPTEVVRSSALTPQDKLVLVMLSSYADEDGYCWPSVAALVEHCGLAERTVRYALAHLRELGVIEVERRARANGSTTSNAYWVRGFDRGTLHLLQGAGASGAGAPAYGAGGPLHMVHPQNSTSKNSTSEHATTTTTAREAENVPGLTFDDESAHKVYLQYRRAHANPTAFDATLAAVRDGMTDGKPVPMDLLGRALLELAGNGEMFNVSRLRGYVRGLSREPLPPRPAPARRGGAVADKDAAVAQVEAILSARGVKL